MEIQAKPSLPVLSPLDMPTTLMIVIISTTRLIQTLMSLCDVVDHNCDGSPDANAVDAETWYFDSDEDDFGDAANSTEQCTQPAGYVADNNDCDDDLPAVDPDATEICDLIDNDCNGFTDDYDADLDLNTTSDFYADLDGDGEGDVDIRIQACIAPPNYVTNSTDCDDGNEDVTWPQPKRAMV